MRMELQKICKKDCKSFVSYSQGVAGETIVVLFDNCHAEFT